MGHREFASYRSFNGLSYLLDSISLHVDIMNHISQAQRLTTHYDVLAPHAQQAQKIVRKAPPLEYRKEDMIY